MRNVFTPMVCLFFFACSGGAADQKPADAAPAASASDAAPTSRCFYPR